MNLYCVYLLQDRRPPLPKLVSRTVPCSLTLREVGRMAVFVNIVTRYFSFESSQTGLHGLTRLVSTVILLLILVARVYSSVSGACAFPSAPLSSQACRTFSEFCFCLRVTIPPPPKQIIIGTINRYPFLCH